MYKMTVQVIVTYIDEKGDQFLEDASAHLEIETLSLHPVIADITWMGVVAELRDRCEDNIKKHREETQDER